MHSKTLDKTGVIEIGHYSLGIKLGLPPFKQRDLSIYIPWPFPPVWGVADNTKEQQKQWGPHSVPLAMTRDLAEFGWHCWSNTAHPTPVFHNLRRFTDAISPTAPTTGLPYLQQEAKEPILVNLRRTMETLGAIKSSVFIYIKKRKKKKLEKYH